MRIEVDLVRNVLRFLLGDGAAAAWDETEAVVDIGSGGRLLGVETAPTGAAPIALELATGGDDLTRSAAVPARVARDESGALVIIEIPRRGPGFEISYPSGNQ